MLRSLVNRLFKVNIHGLENIDYTKPVILMPNHTSLLDAPLLALNLPKDICFVVDTEIAEKYKSIIKYRKHITIDPLNPKSIWTMSKVIHEGVPLLIFPEGRITTTGSLMLINDGIAHLALRTGANIYPITINGLERSKLSYVTDKVASQWFPKTEILVDQPFQILRDKSMTVREQKQRVVDEILMKMQASHYTCRSKQGMNLFNALVDIADQDGAGTEILCSTSTTTKVNEKGEPKEVVVTERMSYKKLIMATHLFSEKVKGVCDQQNVGVLLPNALGHVVTLFALFKIGKTPAILNFSLGAKALLDACTTAKVTTVLTSRKFITVGKMENVIELLSQSGIRFLYLEDISMTITNRDKATAFFQYMFKEKATADGGEVILFTSGSESIPKGVVLSHDNMYANIMQAKSVIDITRKDKLFNFLPMFHSFGLTAGTLLPLLTGTPVHLFPSPLRYKEIPKVAYNINATIIFGTSTFLGAYGKTAHPYHFQSIRYVFAGAEKLKEEVRTLWNDKFGIRIFEGYGTTEASPIVALNTPLFQKKGTVGKLLPCIQYKLERVEGVEKGGQLYIKGPNLMKGYWIHGQGFVSRPEWYDTGDIVSFDRDGFITILDRRKRFAKIAGEMVPLNLVEQVAEECFQSQSAVVAIPDQRKGERLVLFVLNQEFTLSQLRTFLTRMNYSPLMLPTEIKYVTRFPELGSGKRDYVLLKKIALGEVLYEGK